MQAIAGADQIVIAPGTRRLLGSAFLLEDLGEHRLKGIDEPVVASRVVDVGRAEGRFEAARGGGLTPFVGRQREVDELLARWQRASAGAGQVVLLSGEAGIGKSRVTQVLRERLAVEPHTRLRYQCSPYHRGSAFHPIISQLERAAAFERDDSPQVRLDKLESTLVFERGQLAAVAPLLAALLQLPTDRYPPQVLSPQKQRELTMAALVDQALNLAARQPVLMIFEDLHWVDPSTLETLGMLIGRIRSAPILLVPTHRPEFIAPWSGEAHVATLGLHRLSPDEGASIVEQVTSGKPLPAAVLAQIVAKTDGVPLFVEELTKTVLEAGFLRDAGDRYVLDGPLPSLAIPSTLQDSLMARLDRLSPVKEVAQIGACIGREFSFSLLAAVVPMPGNQLQAALGQLVDSELMFCRGDPPVATYSFKHALVQDSAYGSLLKSRRQQVHSQIARALETRFPEVAKAQPELLALHFTQAGLLDDALPRWLGAAQLALSGSRHQEALSHVAAGLDIVPSANPSLRYDLEVALLATGAFCHFAMAGYASPSATELFVRIEALLDRVTDQDVLMSALFGIGVRAWVAADFRKAIATYERLGTVAESAGDTDHLIFGYTALGSALHNGGQLARARPLLEFVDRHYEVDKHFRHVFITAHDAKSRDSAWLGMTCLWSGYPDQARRYARLGIDHSRAIAHPLSLSLALAIGTITYVEAGDFDEATRMRRECIELCDAQSLPFWKGWALVTEGVSFARQGRYRDAAERLPQAIAYLRATGARNGEAYMQAWLSIALAHQGRFDEARRDADEGRAECQRSSELIWLPTATYARAITDLLDPDVDDASAEHWFRAAIDECRSQGNRWLELRYATALARLWHSQGKTHEARELLVPIYAWFTEGFETTDLKDAKARLDDLHRNA